MPNVKKGNILIYDETKPTDWPDRMIVSEVKGDQVKGRDLTTGEWIAANINSPHVREAEINDYIDAIEFFKNEEIPHDKTIDYYRVIFAEIADEEFFH